MPPQTPLPARYQPLSNTRNEIRLLALLPARDTTDTTVHCTLSTHFLADAPDYAALSYVWGDANLTRTILVDGQTVHVTTNLADALAQLRDFGVQTLWVDALCIDQTNDEEKSQQVQKMSDIYRRAGTVVAWVGLADGESGRGVAAVKVLAGVAEAVGLVNVLLPGVGGVAKWRKGDYLEGICGLLLDGSCGIGDGDVGRVIALMEREYWRRLWILQEISLAESVTLVCGRDSVLWSDAEKALAVLKWLRHLAFQVPSAFEPVSSELASLYRPYVLGDWRPPPAAIFSAFMGKQAGLSLFDLLNHANDGTALECSDPRDRVYALLGLLDSSYPPSTPVDYSASYAKVFIQASISMLRINGPIVLLFAGLGAQETHDSQCDLPSWAVDWRCTQRRAQEMWQFVPDPTQDFFISWSDDCLSIAVSAASEAEVFAVVPLSHDLRSVAQRFHQLLEQNQFGRREGKSVPARRVETMLWHALIYTAGTSALSEQEVSALFDTYISNQSPIDDAASEIPLNPLSHPQAPDHSDTPQRTFKDLLWVQTPRVLFITTEGIIGSGPACTKIGDVLHAIPGLEAPVLLRADDACEDPKRWKLVGAAFVDSMVAMDRAGEFFTLDAFWSTNPGIREVTIC